MITLNRIRAGALAAVLTAAAGLLSAGSALADTTSPITDPTQCQAATLTQAFSAWGDPRWYTLAAGQTAGNFDGTGWTLSGGATVTSTDLADGTTGQVLDLPSGATAVTPTMCVDTTYPTARTMLRTVTGGANVFFYVSYAGTQTWVTPKNTGSIHGPIGSWIASSNLNLQPVGAAAGWQLARFTFIASGRGSDTQLYNLYLDPYSKR